MTDNDLKIDRDIELVYQEIAKFQALVDPNFNRGVKLNAATLDFNTNFTEPTAFDYSQTSIFVPITRTK